MKNKPFNSVLLCENKVSFAFSLIFAVFTAFAEIYIASFLRNIIDVGIAGEYGKMKSIVITGVVVVTLYYVMMYLGFRFQNRYLKHASMNLKKRITHQLMNLNVKDAMSINSGENISLLTNDLKILETDYLVAPIQIFAQLVLFVSAIGLMCIINIKMAFCVGALCMLPMGLVQLASKGMEEKQGEITKDNATYTTYSKDILTGLTVIKSFNIKEYVLDVFNKYVIKLEEDKRKYNNKVSLITSISTSIGFFIVIVIFLVGLFMVSKKEMTIGGIVAFVQLLNYLLNPVGILMEKAAKMKGCSPIVDKINVLLVKESVDEGKTDKLLFEKEVKISNLSFRYNEDAEYILKDVNLTLEKGKSYALVGLSGCGKSTLLKLVAGYYDNYEGEILWDDIQINRLNEKSVFALCSMVQQESFIFDETIDTNIKLYREWDADRIARAKSAAQLDKLILEKGEDYNCGENGCRLSGGEKQRITIARALLNDTPVLLMDEATSSLDANTSYAIERYVASLTEKTKLVITHKLIPEILKVYDEIIFMDEGRIAEKGSYDELMEQKGGFYSLCMLNGGSKDKSLKINM